MALNTDFNVSPYYDDYDEQKNFHRVLFRPSVPIQARELTQLQTILQNQIERFGDNIYQQGTIIRGCNFHFDPGYYYVKIRDLQVDGQSVLVSSYANGYVSDSSGLTAEVVNYVQGLESQDPDLSTLFIKYINTGSGGKKGYANGDVLTVYARDYSIQSITINSAGTLYNNSDVVLISGNTGSGASANLVTYANGSIRDVVITDGGSGYTTAPTISITTSTGSSGSLTALNYIAQVGIANSSFTKPVGSGFSVGVEEGIIYQKGNFVRVDKQVVIVDKYSTSPNNISLGFRTTESIVNNSVDTSLLDNAQGYSNYSAPGASRLKLTANLVAISTTNAASDPTFFAVLQFQNGQITKRKLDTQFNSISSELAKRTREESGNYVVKPFTIYSEDIASNTTHLNVVVSSGVGYVDGFRAEIAGSVRTPVRKGTDTDTSLNQTISTNFGNYVIVNEAFGNFDFTNGLNVNLRNAAATDVTDNFGGSPTTPGTVIGTASFKSLVYDSGVPGTPSCKYRMYLYNISMNSGQNFSNVRSIQSSNGVADVVLEGSQAVLKETNYDTLIFSSGANSVSYFSNEQFIYRKVGSTSIATNGVGLVTLTGSEEFPYTASSTLNDTQEHDFIIVPSANAHSTTSLSGTVTTSGNVVTGTSTQFIDQLDVGDYIKFSGNSSYYRVSEITSSTSMKISGSTGPAVTSNTLFWAFPKNIPIRLDRGSANVSIDSNGNTASVYVGNTVNATTSATVYFNSKVDGAAPKTKSVIKDVYVKLSTDKLTANTKGPWCLGIPDVFKVVGVYVGSSNTYSNTSTNYVSNFELVTGQTDNLYGLSYLKKKPGSTLSLSGSNCLLVRVDLFTHGSGYYLSTESYPIDDVTTPLLSNKIRTQDIPYFISPKTNKITNLRDAIDFRPIVANTANASATSVSGATIDPSSSEVLTGSIYYPTPNESFEADITYYLKRIDSLMLDGYGSLSLIEGKPDLNPVPPKVTNGSMKLGSVFVPPYPSLSAKTASEANKTEYSTLIKTEQIKGYTMKDIKAIEDRVNKIEYYSLLNSLEKNATDLVIPSEANTSLNRFKNGFFVDNFSSYNISNTDDPEYTAFIDVNQSILRPKLKQTPISLKANTAASSNVIFKGDYVFPEYTDELFISQPIANRNRNLVQGGWEYYGKVKLFPPYDDFYDSTKGSVNVTVDLATPLNSLVKSINEGLKTTAATAIKVDTSNWVTTTAAAVGRNGSQTRTVTETATTVTPRIDVGGTLSDVQPVGDFLTDFAIKPYMRAQAITVIVTGLRPNAQHFAFFDKVNVSQYCRPGKHNNLNAIDTKGYKDDPNFSFTGKTGDVLKTDSKGVLVFVFFLPENTFFVGDRELGVSDYDQLITDTPLSSATATFNAYNFSKNSSSLTLTTKKPDQIVSSSTTTVSVVQYPQTQVIPALPNPAPAKTNQGCCFVAGTKITMADGSIKNIEDVVPGDMLIGKDNHINRVQELIRPLLGERTLISINGSAPFITNDHPVYCKDGIWRSFDPDATKSKYKFLTDWNIGKLQIGNVIETADLAGLEIKSLSEHEDDHELQVYNFYLDGNHTYIADNLVVHNKGGGGCTPIAQTFMVSPEAGTDCVYLTKIVLYFKTKHPTLGVDVMIRDTLVGFPNANILALKTLTSDSVNISEDGTAATVVEFDTPVYLKAGEEYCVVLEPQGHNPDYLVWTAQAGIPDIANPSLFTNKDWGDGALFFSSNDRVYTPYQSEDLKFAAFIANFNKTEGVVALENSDYEFLSISNTQGSFVGGEQVVQKSNTYLSGSFSCNTSSLIVNTSTSFATSISSGDYVFIVYANTSVSKTGTVSGGTGSAQVNGSSTLFTSEYAAGDYLLINGNVREIKSITNNTVLILDAPLSNSVSSSPHFGVTDSIQITKINSVNSTAFVLKDFPFYNIDGGTSFYGALQAPVVHGTVYSIGNEDDIIIDESNAANSVFKFTTGKNIVGGSSGSTATISSVNNKTVNYSQSYLRYINPPTTSVNIIQKVDGITAPASNTSLMEGTLNSIPYEGQIKSKSNEISSGSKSLKVYTTLNRSNSTKNVAPALDVYPITLVFTENVVNNDYSGETTRYGSAKNRYISKNVVLAEGLDAEDMKVYITAYKPSTSDILVYAKIISSDDNESFDNKDWTLLNQATLNGVYSDSLNETDYKEYEYTFNVTPPSTTLSGIVTSNSNTTIDGQGTTFNSSLSAGDIVKIVNTNSSSDYDIAVIDTVNNDTQITLKTSTSFVSAAATIEKVTQPNAAFKYNRASNVVVYFDTAKGIHTTYKIFALKIVLVSSSTKYIPILKDIRALAVSI